MRQEQQEEDENLRHELDNELESLRSLLYAPVASSSEPAATEAPEAESRPAKGLPVEDQEDDKEYDQFVRELAFEKRAKPKDRTKTEEELAKGEKEALEKAERQRVRRMHGEEDETDDEEGTGRKKRRREKGGDDLEDDFMDEEGEWGGLGAGLGGPTLPVAGDEEETDQGEEGEVTEGDEDGSEEGEDEEGDDEETSEGEESEAEEGDTEVLVKTKHKNKKTASKSSGKKELPYTFPCPSTHDEFLDIVDDVDDSDVPTVIKRIRTLHHPSLAEDNQFKLQVCITQDNNNPS